jgi:voltage-gated potassium channel Kch
LESAKEAGYLTLEGEATEESVLLEAGVTRAGILATVLPSDASNVFITLSARDLNPGLMIIARGEDPATERKLLQAGANRVVLPAHAATPSCTLAMAWWP